MKQPNRHKMDLLFEISWEVCNKVGGIYTVLSTKADSLKRIYKDNLIFIGPDVWSADRKSPYFIEDNSVLSEWKLQSKLPYGLSVKVGRWDIPSRPFAVLVDFKSLYERKNEIYTLMWDNFRVDSLHAYGDYDEACMFGIASAIVLQDIVKWANPATTDKVIAHFDEWTVGMGLLYIRLNMPKVATVFTTHATSIGRSICGNNKLLYEYLPGYFGDQMAEELNMQSKHSLEKAAAHYADAFTTVSDVTAAECSQLLEKTPDVVTPNGFDDKFVPVGSDYSNARKSARNTLLKVASALIGHEIDSKALLIATSGRNEFRNKGLDSFLDTLNVLNNRKCELQRDIIAFVLVPSWINGPRDDLFQAICDKKTVSSENKFITHSLIQPCDDAVNNRIYQLGLDDVTSSKVKVIYVPSYLNGNDGIFNKSYYDLLPGFDITAFPSYYEPWGYTPLESIAFGIPTITTNLSGFGQWILSNFVNGIESCGVKVINRSDLNYTQVVETMADTIINFSKFSYQKLSAIRRKSITTSKSASWNMFIDFYKKAYDIATDKSSSR
ncbi:MAG: glycogen/starch synthase [Muribaculaceae bacterium]|nr:glycogen/starch synthase [Muribaculaceae bacterium]